MFMITFAPRFPAIWLSETYAHSDNLSRLICKLTNVGKKINMLFTCLGRSVQGKTVPLVLSTARGCRLRAVLKTAGTVFPYTDLPAGK